MQLTGEMYYSITICHVMVNVLCFVQVNFIKDDGQVIHFNNPKVQASLGANTFAVMGHAETKRMSLMTCSM